MGNTYATRAVQNVLCFPEKKTYKSLLKLPISVELARGPKRGPKRSYSEKPQRILSSNGESPWCSINMSDWVQEKIY